LTARREQRRLAPLFPALNGNGTLMAEFLVRLGRVWSVFDMDLGQGNKAQELFSRGSK